MYAGAILLKGFHCRGGSAVVIKCAQGVSFPVRVALGFPIKNAQSFFIWDRLDFADQVGDETVTAIDLVPGHPDFADHDGFLIASDEVGDVGQAFLVSRLPIGCSWIEREADDVPFGAVLSESVEVPSKQIVVVSI